MAHYLTLVLMNEETNIDELLKPYGWPGDDCFRCLEAAQMPEANQGGRELTEAGVETAEHEHSDSFVITKQLLYGDCPTRWKPSPACYGSKCTSKPECHWDWWVVGGRWNGYLKEVLATTNNPHRSKDDELLSCPIQDLPHPFPAEYVPLALITPDGKWYERCEEGDEAKTLWAEKVRELLEQFDDAEVLVCDMHI